MSDELKTDQELVRLQSMGERVQRLRSQLKDLRKDSYSVVGASKQEQLDDMKRADGVSQEIHMTEK